MDSPATPGFRQIVGRETELEHLEGAWDEELGRELAQLLPSLGHAGGDGAIADERYRAHRAVSRLLAILADAQPLVLILDDLHWSDGASIELIAALVRRRPAAPVLLALGFRPGQAADRLSAAVAVPGVDRIELGGLTEEEAAQLLDGVDSGSVAAIYRHGGGNPFYLEQLGRTHDSTFLRAVETGAGGGVPSAVAGAIAGELEPLPPQRANPARRGRRGRRAVRARLRRGHRRPRRGRRAHRARRSPRARPRAPDAGAAPVHVPPPSGAQAVYESLRGGWRLAAHARAAEALAVRGAAAAERAHHVEQSARHSSARRRSSHTCATCS